MVVAAGLGAHEDTTTASTAMCRCSECAMCAHDSGSAIRQGHAAAQSCRKRGHDGEATALGNRDVTPHVFITR
jgi:hypothetical protein